MKVDIGNLSMAITSSNTIVKSFVGYTFRRSYALESLQFQPYYEIFQEQPSSW